jgi:hypothetical protein
MSIFTPSKCFGCRKKFGQNDIPKYALTADGANHPWCKSCYASMGRPGGRTNIIRHPPKPPKKPKEKKPKKDPFETLVDLIFG